MSATPVVNALPSSRSAEGPAPIEHSDRMTDRDIEHLWVTASGTADREKLTSLSSLAHQMSAYRPLTAEEQFELLAIYRQGQVVKQELQDGKHRSRRAKSAADKAIVDADRSLATLVGSMFRLVVVITRELATERFGVGRALGMLEDLVSEANVALVQSVSDYREERCPTFAIYAGRVVRDRVRMSLAKQDAITPSPSWVRTKRIFVARAPKLEQELGRKPTTAEQQEDLLKVCMTWATKHLTAEERALPEVAQDAAKMAKLRKQGMLGAINRLEEVLVATRQVDSLDRNLEAYTNQTVGDTLPDTATNSLTETVEAEEMSRDVHAALANLTDRERDIVMYRFGFYPPPSDSDTWTYARLSPKFKISAERVRQIERKALTKLRGPSFDQLVEHLRG